MKGNDWNEQPSQAEQNMGWIKEQTKGKLVQVNDLKELQIKLTNLHNEIASINWQSQELTQILKIIINESYKEG